MPQPRGDDSRPTRRVVNTGERRRSFAAITYAAGTGNDVAMFTVPEPSSAAMLDTAGLMLTGVWIRRWRRR